MEELPKVPKEPVKTVKIGNRIEEMVYRHTYYEKDGTKVVREIYQQKKARKPANSNTTPRSKAIKEVTELGLALKISAYLADKIVRRLKRIKSKLQKGRTPLDIDRAKLSNFSCNIFTYINEVNLLDILIEKKSELKLTEDDVKWLQNERKDANLGFQLEVKRAKTNRDLTEDQIVKMVKAGKDPNAD